MDVNCPYCEKENYINPDDGFGYDENFKHVKECPHCEKSFVFQTTIVYHYEAEKADCLNDDKHKYELTKTFPKQFSRMECKMCGIQRELTDPERTKFNIGTKASYLESLKY